MRERLRVRGGGGKVGLGLGMFVFWWVVVNRDGVVVSWCCGVEVLWQLCCCGGCALRDGDVRKWGGLDGF